MSILKNFRNRDFPEQIGVLNQIQSENIKEAIDDLFDLYLKPLKDTMIDHMVVTTLQTLLAKNEYETVKRIKSGSAREKILCINIAGMNRFATAVPLLHSLLRNDSLKEMHSEGFFALGEIMSPESLPIFREYITHPDEMMSSLAMKMVGQYRDEESVQALVRLIEEAEKSREYETCSLRIAMAVEALAAINSEESLICLVSRIHQRNATIRRVIHDALVKAGASAVPLIAAIFDYGDIDHKIMAANILGLIGNKQGGEAMVRALDAGKADHPNIRYAIYEAFGKIPFLKGMTCLIDALQTEEDDLLLMAVVTALDSNVSSGVIAKMKEQIHAGGKRSEKLISTIIATRSVHLFSSLHTNADIRPMLMAELLGSTQPDTLAAFKVALAKMEGQEARDDLEKLCAQMVTETGRNILAVDDSKAMLSFYGSIAHDLGLTIMTMDNGKDALNMIEMGSTFDLIITDMNMPVMDGLELTREIRKKIGDTKVPIVMVTTESEQSQREMARSAGVNAFITKPFSLKTLKETLDSFLH